MKIENNNNQTYLLGTITEVCHTIGSVIERDWKNGREFTFPKFHFGTIDEFDRMDRSLRQVAITIEGWYGCESIANEFGTNEVATILADYCGGGAASAGSLWLDELYADTVGDTIATVIIKSLEMNESVNKNSVVLVEVKSLLPIYSDEELAQLRTKYEKFKFQWMLDHGHTIDSLVSYLASSLEDSGEPLWETYRAWEEYTGFDGEIWPCFNEWLDNEGKEEN